MSDETTAGSEQPTAPATEQVEQKATKTARKLTGCLCSSFEVGIFDETVGTDKETIYTTGCTQTTGSTFAQGHDARLVSFLVDGHFDGYTIRMVQGDQVTTFATPADAAALGSEKLRDKAARATENRKAKNDARAKAKADREAVKAARAQEKAAAKQEQAAEPPKAVGAEVVAGSSEGDRPTPPEGVVQIKVGRWEYDATIDADGTATYTDGKGETLTVERDGYRLLAGV